MTDCFDVLGILDSKRWLVFAGVQTAAGVDDLVADAQFALEGGSQNVVHLWQRFFVQPDTLSNSAISLARLV